MRYTTTAVVLATLAIGQAAAGSVHHRHAHDRRAPAPSAAPEPLPQDWNAISYTFSKCQQFGTWGRGPGCDDAAEPGPTPPPVPVRNDVQHNAVVDNDESSNEEEHEPEPEKKAPKYGGGSPSSGAKGGADGLGAAIFKKLNAQPVASNGMINSNGGAYSMDLVNAAGEELGFYCWPGNKGWNIQVDSPIYAATIPAGKTFRIYTGTDATKIACAALHSDGRMDSTNGIPVETQIEFTFIDDVHFSTFDVSQLESSSGHHVLMESSVCHSESNGKCSYQCKNGAPCGYVPGEVFVKDCLGEGTTGNVERTDGGCSVGPKKHVKVTFQ